MIIVEKENINVTHRLFRKKEYLILIEIEILKLYYIELRNLNF